MKRKILSITLVILLVVSMLSATVSAASLAVSMTSSVTTVQEATEFTVTIRISNIDAGVNGINTLEGVLTYDTSVFEALTTSSIDPLSDWSVTYTPETGKLMLHKMSWANEDQEVAQITLKTKKNTSGKSGYIRYTDIQASNAESEIQATDVSTTITVGNLTTSDGTGNTSQGNTNTNTPQPIVPTNTSTNTNTNTRTNTNTNTNTRTNTNTNTNRAQSSYVENDNNTNSTSGDDIPYTGTSDNIMRAIFVVLVIAGISYFKYESIKEV